MHIVKVNNSLCKILYKSPVSQAKCLQECILHVVSFASDPCSRILSKQLIRPCVLVFLFFRGFSTRNITLLRRAYTMYVCPILEYAFNVWNPHLLKHLNAVERVQHHFTKRITELRNVLYSERLACLELDTLQCRHLKADLILYTTKSCTTSLCGPSIITLTCLFIPTILVYPNL